MPLPPIATESIVLFPETRLSIDGGLSETGSVPSLLDGYSLPEKVVLFRFEEMTEGGAKTYVLDIQAKFVVALKNASAPTREPLRLAMMQQTKKVVAVEEMTFDEAIEVAHAQRPEKPCEGLVFLDDFQAPDFFHIV